MSGYPFVAGGIIQSRRLVKLSASRTVVHCGAGEEPIGVSGRTTASGRSLTVLTDGVRRIKAGESLTAGDVVESGADGTVVTLASGIRCGTVIEDCPSDGFAKVQLEIEAAGGGEGVTDHGALTGLTDDDHPQYDGGLGFYGDGSDGNVTISTTITLARDMFYDALTITGSGTLNTNGYRVFCKTSCTVQASGVIRAKTNSAIDASGVTKGVSYVTNTLLGGTDGATGGGVSANPADTIMDTYGNYTGSATFTVYTLGGSGGQQGGGGGVSAPLPEEAYGAPDRTAYSSLRSLPFALYGFVWGGLAAPYTSPADSVNYFGGNVPIPVCGGIGGGSGDNSSGTGGGGGGGGGVMILCAKSIANSGTISAAGGAGANGVGGDASGGSGGGGGLLIAIYRTKSGNAFTVAGGARGIGVGNGEVGPAQSQAGGAGTLIELTN